MIRNLHLKNYKAFESYRVTFGDHAVLIGPNNAGKSTVIGALRAAAAMIAHGRRRNPTGFDSDRDGLQRTHSLTAASLGIEDENLRHEFRFEETRIELGFKGGASVRAVWAADEDLAPFFYFVGKGGTQIASTINVKRRFSSIATIPPLTPVEHTERLLSAEYVSANLSSRLASRHFRNQVLALRDEASETHRDGLEEFYAFAEQWLPELSLEAPDVRMGESRQEVDLYYREGRVPKEIVWAGDGIQVFLQLLLQIFRVRDVSTLVIDEPEVFLHPDLQRRLLRLLESLEAQVILATHSPEILLEAPPEAAIWIDRGRKRAIRAPSGEDLVALSTVLGAQYNLRLARALRHRSVVFLEGNDAKILRPISRTLGLERLVNEIDLVVVPLDGASNWRLLESFRWVAEKLLKGAVEGYVILDRDLHDRTATNRLQSKLATAGLRPHIWRRHELENYLVVVPTLARASGADEQWIRKALLDVTDHLQSEVVAQMVSTATADQRGNRKDLKTITAGCLDRVNRSWESMQGRLELCPGKELISGLNRSLQDAGYKTVTPQSLASEMWADEVPDELAQVLAEIESL